MTRLSPPDLGLRTWPSVRDEPPLVLVPVGSVEQHGPHLPLATDAIVAAAVAREAARVLAARAVRVLVAPTVAYGASGEHEGFPGTMSIGHEALHSILVELGRSTCHWAAGVVFVNGHGGNVPTIKKAVELLRYEGRGVAWTSCDLPGADAHAGRTETSLLLALTPDAVVVDDIEVGCTTPVTELMPRLRVEGIASVAPNGVLGDPRGSTAEEGRTLFATLVGQLVAELTGLDVVGAGRLTCDPAARDLARAAAAPCASDSRLRETTRVALVTGAAGGIGTAVVDRLVGRGHVVYAVDLHAVDDRHGDRVVPVVADVREAAEMGRVVDLVRDRHGALHVVVAGAAVIAGGAPLWETDDAVLETLWRADVVSVWHTAKATMPLLLEQHADDRPSFVAIASVAGQRGLFHLSAYGMAKHAVVGLVRGLAADVAGTPVTVACVCPGSTDTAMLAATAELYGLDDIEPLVQEQSSRRALRPDEVAAVVELACLAGPVLHGAVLPADGGFRL